MKPEGRLPPGAKALVLALVLALLSRTIVFSLDLPGILNFLFFPVLLLALLGSHTTGTQLEKHLSRAFTIFSLGLLASMITNFSSPLATLILWASLSIPFIAILVALRSWARLSTVPTLHTVFWVFLMIQAGVTTIELVILGRSSDAAQGFLSGQGAGAHVVGFVGIGTAFYLAMRLIEEHHLRRNPSIYAAIAAGLMTAVATGTLQSLLAVAVAGATFLLTRRSRLILTSPIALAAALLIFIFSSWTALAPSGRGTYGSDFAEYKGLTASTIIDEYRSVPHHVLFGLGPGETATRVAWLGAGGGSNLVGALDVESGSIGRDLLAVEQAKPFWRSSSLTSPWSTWLGVWGDLGVFGFVTYSLVWGIIAKACAVSPDRRAGLYLVLYLAILGSFYNWLEEPVLTLFLSLPLADAILRNHRGKTTPRPQTTLDRHSGG